MKLSDTLSITLNSVEHPLARELRYRQGAPVDYLDLERENGALALSFLATGRAAKAAGDFFSSPLRQSGRIGRVIKKVLPQATDDDIRTFVESISGIVEIPGFRLEETNGSGVYGHYMIGPSRCVRGGTMTGSCYQGKAKPEYFTLFENNPERFLSIAGFDGELLAGRALLIRGNLLRYDEEPVECWFVDTLVVGDNKYLEKFYARFRELEAVYRADFSDRWYWGRQTITNFKEFRSENLAPGTGLHHWTRVGHRDNVISTLNPTWLDYDNNYTLPKEEWVK